MQLLNSRLLKRALESERVVKFLMKTVPPLDRVLLHASRGWLNTGMQSVALVETVGAKTGAKREIATLCMPQNLDLVLVGSNWGHKNNPAWVINIRAHPEVRVTFRGYKGAMLAREAEGAERAALWEELVKFNPQYARYQQATTRHLPVLVLSRL